MAEETAQERILPRPSPADTRSVTRDDGRTLATAARERRVTILGAAATAAIAWIYTGILYRVWDMRWEVPLYEQFTDARAVGANVKNVMEHGWWLNAPALNAPFGQDAHDFPGSGESLQFLAFKLIGFVVPSYAHTMNLYFLGGFGLVAAVAFLVLRQLRFSWQISLVLALAYAFLPFHFWHQQDHLTRSTYYFAPLACLLMLWALAWRTKFLRDPARGIRGNLRGATVAAAVGLAVVVAISETMTNAFTMTLLVASAAVAAIRWRDPRHLIVGGGLAAVMMVAFLAVSSPSLIYWAEHGSNPTALHRAVAESERYGLKLTWLVLPEPGHRFEPFDDLGARAREGTPLGSEPGQALGLLGTIGFVAALLAVLLHGLRGRARRDPRPLHERESLLDNASLLIVLGVLFSVISGFSVLLAVVGFDEIRTWNRISMLVAFLALVVTAILIERLLAWAGRRWHPRAALLSAVPLLLLPVALLDGQPPFPQGTIFETLGNRQEAERQWVNDELFVNEIEARMPDGAAIFQFPVIPFPEGGALGTMRAYDQLRGYVHDDGTLRWSNGGVKGRPEADWQQRVGQDPVLALPALLGMGFTGLWVDGLGYGGGIQQLDARLQDKIGYPPTIVSNDGRWRFYDLRDYRKTIRLSDAELQELAERRFGISPPSGR
jgi:hypothetical protein